MKNIPRKSAVNPAPARMIYCRDARPSSSILPPLSLRGFPAAPRRSRVRLWLLAAVAVLAASAPLIGAAL